jgi:hypothetical protein
MEETEAKLSGGEPLSIDQLIEYLPPLKEVPRAQLERWGKGAAVLHSYGEGETVCRGGEFGSTAYYIISGSVDIFIQNPLTHLRTKPSRGFLGRSVARMKSFLVDDHQDRRAEAHQRKFIGIDANIDLPVNTPIAQLGAGELFGEMSCRTFQYNPHEAREDTVLFPAFRGIVSAHEFDSLGEDFEKKEDELFGDDGFEKMVDKVAQIEKNLGIYELAQFTPKM